MAHASSEALTQGNWPFQRHKQARVVLSREAAAAQLPVPMPQPKGPPAAQQH
jgi:hypothetical protein